MTAQKPRDDTDRDRLRDIGKAGHFSPRFKFGLLELFCWIFGVGLMLMVWSEFWPKSTLDLVNRSPAFVHSLVWAAPILWYLSGLLAIAVAPIVLSIVNWCSDLHVNTVYAFTGIAVLLAILFLGNGNPLENDGSKTDMLATFCLLLMVVISGASIIECLLKRERLLCLIMPPTLIAGTVLSYLLIVTLRSVAV